MKAQPGHLSNAGLNLKQSDQVRESLKRAQQKVEAEKRRKLEPVRLDWNRK